MLNSIKVSIGIPTYNRPDGLFRTIKQILGQTHKNIEVIISNNDSSNPLVKDLINKCAELDSRIVPFHQDKNIGIVKNFKFVLQVATSEYFMWAADDDEWDSRFVERCLGKLQESDAATAMPGFLRHNRPLNVRGVANLPRMTGENPYQDAVAFYETMPHSIFYGLHRRESIEWLLTQEDSLFDDEYFIIRQIVNNGIVTFPEEILYVAGIEDVEYKIKLPKEGNDRYFYQIRRLIEFVGVISESPKLLDLQKLDLLRRIVVSKLHFVLIFEKKIRSDDQLKIALDLYNFLRNLDVDDISNYTELMTVAKSFGLMKSEI